MGRWRLHHRVNECATRADGQAALRCAASCPITCVPVYVCVLEEGVPGPARPMRTGAPLPTRGVQPGLLFAPITNTILVVVVVVVVAHLTFA